MMFFSVQVSLERDGKYKAMCPELGFTIKDSDKAAAIEKIEFMIAEWLVASKDVIIEELYPNFSYCESHYMHGTFSMLKINNDRKLLFIPRLMRKL